MKDNNDYKTYLEKTSILVNQHHLKVPFYTIIKTIINAILKKG